MNNDDDHRFRIRPGAPRQRGGAFVNKVLRQVNKTGGRLGKASGMPAQRPGSRLGRGHVVARFAGHGLGLGARRVTVKARLVNLARKGQQSTATHLRYIEREGVDRQGGQGRAYGPTTDTVDLEEFKQRSVGDRHQFRFIVSPEDAEQLDDLRTYTRHLMMRMEADLGSRLEWIAVDHWNTDNPHTHLVLRGKDDTGKDLIISGDYIAQGMRGRASELATRWLGPRTELEVQQSLLREVAQERWTGLDRILQRQVEHGGIKPETFADPRLQRHRQALIGRLQSLQNMGLAVEVQPGAWTIKPEAKSTLRAMGERADIVRTMQRAMSGRLRELSVFQPGDAGPAIVGRVVGKDLVDELYDKGYLVIDGVDGKVHYVSLPARSKLEDFPAGAVVEAKVAGHARMADLEIARLAIDGFYRSDQHLAAVQGGPVRDPGELVVGHVRRLEALRRGGIVERISDGIWRVPPDLPERGRQYDLRRLDGGADVALKSQLPIERQVRAIGATWLDQQLIGGAQGIGEVGFGAEVKDALRQRTGFLVDQGLAKPVNGRVLLARNLLQTLRDRELAGVAERIAADAGLEYRQAVDGERVSGVYRRTLMLVSGRYAMLDNGMGFSLVRWKPVIEQRLGQVLAATVHGSSVSWEVGKQRGLAI